MGHGLWCHHSLPLKQRAFQVRAVSASQSSQELLPTAPYPTPRGRGSHSLGEPRAALEQAGLTQPGEVESNLLPKVPADMIQHMVLAPLPSAGPVLEEDLALAEAAGSQLPWPELVGTLQGESGGG